MTENISIRFRNKNINRRAKMTYGVKKIKTCYGNTEKGVTIFDSRRLLSKGRS